MTSVTIRRWDTMSEIAHRNNITLTRLRRDGVNIRLTDNYRSYAAQVDVG